MRINQKIMNMYQVKMCCLHLIGLCHIHSDSTDISIQLFLSSFPVFTTSIMKSGVMWTKFPSFMIQQFEELPPDSFRPICGPPQRHAPPKHDPYLFYIHRAQRYARTRSK